MSQLDIKHYFVTWKAKRYIHNMETKIKSVSEFVEAIIEKTLSKKDDEASQELWFRGEGNINWETPLVPNSYRTPAKTFKNNFSDNRESMIHLIKSLHDNSNSDESNKI